MNLTEPAILLAAPPRASLWRRLKRRLNLVFLLTVVVPTGLGAAYYGWVASDVFISESRFVIRSPQRSSPSGLGAMLLQGTGFARSQDDTYSVLDFIRSRDALRELEAAVGVRRMLSAPEVDRVNRLPGLLEWDPSFEGLYRHYLRHVGVDYDSASSISVLRVRAYQPEDARAVNDRLLTLGERLVNQLNTRIRQDLIASAEAEVRQAEERSKAAAAALAGFRSDRKVFDPDRQSAMQLTFVGKLREELMASEAQLAQVQQLTPNNPQVSVLQGRVESLRKSIAAEDAKITGGGSLSAKSPGYDRLVLEKGFADRQLATALASLESARSEAARKQLYLERLVQPNLPDAALEPRRLRAVFTVFLLGLIAWGIASFVLASIREHGE